MVTKKIILFLLLVSLSSADDLFLSNNLCLKYVSDNRISQAPGECTITCKIVNRQKACATRDLSCVAYATHIYQTQQAQSGNFYCNVLPYESSPDINSPSPDEARVCNTYKNSISYSSRASFCKLTCAHLYVITSQNGAYEKKFQCDTQNNFAGCLGYKTFLQSQSLQPGSYSCEIYNHGDNFNYNRVAGGSNNGGSAPAPTNNVGSNNNGYVFPSVTGLFASGVQSAVNTGSQLTQTFSDIVRAPFQFG